MLNFGEYAPDQAQTDTSYSAVANNVVAGLNSYKPFRSPVVVSDALPNTPQGSSYFYQATGDRINFAGDSVALYRLDDETWTDVKGAVYTGTTDDLWEFAQFGSLAIATNGVDVIQKYDVDVDSAFSALGGTPPIAKFITVVKDFVVVANTSTGSNPSHRQVRWSAINDAESWTIGTNSADVQTLPDGGDIRGIVGGENGYIFQDRAITRMTFTASNVVFRFDKIGVEFGCLSSKSIAQHGGKTFFLGTDGFYMLENDQFTSIGSQKVNATFFANVRPDYVDAVHSSIDQKNQIVAWFYGSSTSQFDSLVADRVLIYNWAIDKWSSATIESVGSVSTLSVPASLDNTAYSTQSTDDLNYSLDDPSLFGNDPFISVFGIDNKLYSLSGTPLEATLETGDTQPHPTARTFISGVTVLTEASNATASVGTKERVSDTAVFSSDESAEDTGVIPLHSSGRFLNIRVKIPAAASWNNAQGIVPEFKKAGSR